MKKNLFITLAVVGLAFAMNSCGDSASSSGDAMLFGKVPGIVEKFNQKNAEMKEKLENATSEGDAKSVIEDYDKLFAKTRAEVEEAAQKWSGSSLALESNDEWTIKSPVVATFDGFFSQSSFDVRYKLAGDVVIANTIPLDENNAVAFSDGTMVSKNVLLKGYDADGNEVTSTRIGIVTPKKTENGGELEAGTPLKLDPIIMSTKNPGDYLKIKTLKLEIEYYK